MNGLNTTYSYDALCRQTNVAFPDGGFRQTGYFGFGNPATQYIQTLTPAVDNTGALWERSFLDGLGRSYRDSKRGPAAGQDIIVDTTYSPRGGTVASRSFPYYSGDPARVSTFLYDALDRPVRLTHPDGSLVRKAYGAADTFTNTTVTDEFGRSTVTHYDAYGQMVRTDRTLAGATVSTYYSYDLLGHMTGIQDAAGNHWYYTYDSLGRKTVAADPDLGTWTYQYDNADRPTQVTDALGQATRYSYDALGRTLSKVTRYGTAQAATTTYGYDEDFPGAYANTGHLTSTHNDVALTEYDYDSMGRKFDDLLWTDGVGYVVLTGYDTGGRVRWKQYRNDPNVIRDLGTSTNQWGYDTAGRLRTIPGVQTAATYTADGQAASVTRANGVTTTYSYQPLRLWLTGMKTTNAAGAVLQNLAYTRDTRGRITAAGSNIGYENWTYGYDNFDRLTSATNAADSTLTQSFAYDAIGNITWNSLRGSYTYPAPGQPHPHGVIWANSTTFTYDANGNTTSGGATTVTYDGENRLVQDATSSFVYAPDGSRLKKTVNGTTTLYVGDDWEVTGGVSTYYLPGDAVMTGGVVSWLHRDVLGSVRLTTNAAGATVQRAQYRPYGERLEAVATLMTSKGFIGERNDETGLVYLHARYLNPYLGRFITPDPSPDPTQPGVGLNRYAYAGDSPIVNLDTSGLMYDFRNAYAGVEGFGIGYSGPPREFGGYLGVAGGAGAAAVIGEAIKDVLDGLFSSGKDEEDGTKPSASGGEAGKEVQSTDSQVQSGADEPQDKLVNHHSDPKFLGGDPNQDTTPMEKEQHEQLHSDLNKHLRDYQDDFGNTMEPKKNNPGQAIRDNFSREQRLKATRDFYDRYKDKYPGAERDFSKQHPDLGK
jgi:RHS repeat-associated protein